MASYIVYATASVATAAIIPFFIYRHAYSPLYNQHVIILDDNDGSNCVLNGYKLDPVYCRRTFSNIEHVYGLFKDTVKYTDSRINFGKQIEVSSWLQRMKVYHNGELVKSRIHYIDKASATDDVSLRELDNKKI